MLKKFQHFSARIRLLIALLAGIVASTALAPLFLLPMMYIAFCVLGLLAFSTDQPKEAFKEGLAFGFGYFVSGMYWITFSLMVDPSAHAWLAPLAVPAIAAVLALAIAIPLGFIAQIPTLLPRALALILLLSVGEWLRGYMFQFPWNNFSQSFGLSNALLQPLSVLGRNGYSLLVICSLVLLPLGIATTQRRTIFLCSAVAIPLAFALWGMVRLDQAPNPNANFWSNAGVRIVQPNISQQDKLNPELAGTNLTKLIDLSFDNLPGWVNHVIWPEVALHLNIDKYQGLQEDLGSLLPAGGVLIAGTLRSAGDRYHNSVVSIHDDGSRRNLHDKVTLVPFGEVSPLPFLDGIASAGLGNFVAGQGLHNNSVGQLPNFSTLICYEVIFSGNVRPQGVNNTQWLLNITNDAWFGESSGPYQHAAIARMRAIEEGLPLVRAANTGVSIVYDAYGRILAERPLGTEGTINIRIPKPLGTPTFFSEYPNLLWLLMLSLLSAFTGAIWFLETKPRLRFEL